MWHGVTIKKVIHGYDRKIGKATFVEFTVLGEMEKTFMVRLEGHRENDWHLERDTVRKHEFRGSRMVRREK